MSLSRVRELNDLSAVRLTVRLLLVFAAVAVFAWAGTYWLVQREMLRLADARIGAQMELALHALSTGKSLPAPGFGQSIDVIYADGGPATLPYPMPTSLTDGWHLYNPVGPEYRYLVRTLPNGNRLVVAENMERQDEMLDTLSAGLQVSIAAVLLAGALAGFWFASRAQKRLDLMGDALKRVADGRLETRIALPGPDDDLSRLAKRINATTDRLEKAVEQMRVQSTNIAHDLRTPLARLRAGLEQSLLDLTERDHTVDAAVLGSALEQIDRIVGTFNALLRLSRLASGAGQDAFGTFDLRTHAERIADTFGPVVEQAGQQLALEIDEPAMVLGDPDLLMQMAANLIQNALVHGAPGQTITLGVRGPVLSVADQGPGIPCTERENVLKPLYQLGAARQDDRFGMGLTMVAAIAELHGAALSLAGRPGGKGLKVTLRFPPIAEL